MNHLIEKIEAEKKLAHDTLRIVSAVVKLCEAFVGKPVMKADGSLNKRFSDAMVQFREYGSSVLFQVGGYRSSLMVTVKQSYYYGDADTTGYRPCDYIESISYVTRIDNQGVLVSIDPDVLHRLAEACEQWDNLTVDAVYQARREYLEAEQAMKAARSSVPYPVAAYVEKGWL